MPLHPGDHHPEAKAVCCRLDDETLAVLDRMQGPLSAGNRSAVIRKLASLWAAGRLVVVDDDGSTTAANIR